MVHTAVQSSLQANVEPFTIEWDFSGLPSDTSQEDRTYLSTELAPRITATIQAHISTKYPGFSIGAGPLLSLHP